MASVSFFTPDICGKENPGEDQEESHRNPGLSAPYEVMRGMEGGIKKSFQVPIFPIEQEMEMETKVSGVQRKKSQASYSLSVGSPLFEVEVRVVFVIEGVHHFCRMMWASETSLPSTKG